MKNSSEEHVEALVRGRMAKFLDREKNLVEALQQAKDELIRARREQDLMWTQLNAKTAALEELRKKSDLQIHTVKEQLRKASFSRGGDAQRIKDLLDKVKVLEGDVLHYQGELVKRKQAVAAGGGGGGGGGMGGGDMSLNPWFPKA